MVSRRRERCWFTGLDVCLVTWLAGWPCTIRGPELWGTRQLVRFTRLRKDKDLEVYLDPEVEIQLSQAVAPSVEAEEGRKN